MKRHPNHIIDENAQRIFRDSLPATWVINEQINDYGKDYLVERVDEAGELTGESFFVQLKGHQNVKIHGDPPTVGHTLKNKHLEYYADKVHDLPVFLFVIDVTKQTGCWLFLQKRLLEDSTWRKKKSATIRVPVANDIRSIPQLESSLYEARRWLKSKFPPPISDIIAIKRHEVQKLDSRFDVSIQGDQFLITSKERIPLTITPLKKDSAESKLSHMIDTGFETYFEPGEIRLTGSKLIEFFEKHGGRLRAGHRIEATISLVAYDDSGNETGRVDNIVGLIEGGRKQLTFSGQTAKEMLSVAIGPVTNSVSGKATINFKLRSNDWEGKPLRTLPYFDQIAGFFIGALTAKRTAVKYYRDGNKISEMTFPFHKAIEIRHIGQMCSTIAKARRIAARFGVNPIWSADACDDELIQDIDQLHGVFFENGWTRKCRNLRIRATFSNATNLLEDAHEITKPSTFVLSSGYIYTFFDTSIDVGRFSHTFTNMVVQKPSPEEEVENGEKVLYLVGNDSTTEEITSDDDYTLAVDQPS